MDLLRGWRQEWALMTVSGSLGIFLELCLRLLIWEGYTVEPFYCPPNLTYVILLELCSLSPNKKALPPSTPAPAGEAQIFARYCR